MMMTPPDMHLLDVLRADRAHRLSRTWSDGRFGRRQRSANGTPPVTRTTGR
jgi:hypothetical protein